MKTKTYLVLITLALALSWAQLSVAQDTLIGTYTVDYYHNCAGSYTVQGSNTDYTMANPYYGNVIPPGPVFITVPPGQYKLVTDSGVGCSIWSGDATNGTWYASGNGPGQSVTINNAFGQIAIYFWDWNPYDNDPSVQTTISVYQVDSVASPTLGIHLYSGLTITGMIGATYDLEYKTDLNSTNWTPLAEITLTNSSYTYFDTDSVASPRRFYRVVPKP